MTLESIRPAVKLATKGFLAAVVFPLFLYAECSDHRGTNPTDADIDRSEVAALLGRIADWQIANFSYAGEGSPTRLHDHGIDAWTNATLYIGMLHWAETAPSPDIYLDWLTKIGEKNRWAMPANFVNSSYGLHHADELCMGQFYMGMYERYRRPEMLAAVRERLDTIIANPPDPDMSARTKQSWTWCDALFMAPPVYSAMAAVTGDKKYLAFMDMLFKRTYAHLYNTEDGLFFRDDTYFDKHEANGAKVYWGRGNGWVAAGLANTLEAMPEDSPYRTYYEELFRRFVTRLVEFQDESGSWHASLLNPDSYPAPEISATALITYAAAWGINNGLLDRETFLPVVVKGWKVIAAAVDNNGKVGWVQHIGAGPASVTVESTATYGVGAVLMAGAEIIKMKLH